jgi:hypothetical protein
MYAGATLRIAGHGAAHMMNGVELHGSRPDVFFGTAFAC